MLYEIDGACSVSHPPFRFSPLGPSISSRFSPRPPESVGYTIAYPPGHRQGDRLPLVVMLHGFRGNHSNAVSGMSPGQAVALHCDDTPLRPMAMVAVEGGSGCWNPHPGDDPMAVLIDDMGAPVGARHAHQRPLRQTCPA